MTSTRDATGTADSISSADTAAATRGWTSSGLGAHVMALGASLDDEHDVVVLLQRIVEIAVKAIDGAESAGVTIALGERVYTAVHTDERTLEVDSEQYEAGDGPCLHAARSGETVILDVDESAQQWPTFAAAGRRHGIRSFLASPLHAGDVTLGALNLYGTSAVAFDTSDADILEILTATAARAIGEFVRFRSATQVADDIRAAIKHREIIEQAKGMLMAIHQIDAEAASAMLHRECQVTHRKLRDVSAEVVRRFSAPNVTTQP
jgi:GAF domain-containing protein